MSRRKSSRRAQKERHRVGKVTVYFRKPSWWIYYYENGKTRRIRIGRDREEAERHAAEVNAQITCGVRSTFQFEKVKIEDLVRRWLEHHELVKRSAMRTVNRYRTAIAHLTRFIEERRPSLTMDTLTVPIAEEFVKFLRTVRISPNGSPNAKKVLMRDRGVLSVLRTCRAFWNFAYHHRHVPPYSKNPFTEIRIEAMRIDDMKPKYVLTPDEEAEFLKACSPWEFRVFFTLAFTGMRPGELSHLLVDDVDFETRTMFIRNHHELGWCTKTRNERRVYLFDELRDVIREAIGCRTCGLAFLAPRYASGKDIAPLAGVHTPALAMELARRIEEASQPGESQRRIEAAQVERLWRDMGAIGHNRIRQRFLRVAKRIGKPHLTSPYSFRHTMATAMQTADVDMFVRRTIIGHTSAEMLAHYTHTTEFAVARGMKQAAELRPKSLEQARARLGSTQADDGRAQRLA